MRISRRHYAVLITASLLGTGALAFSLGGSRWLDPITTFHVGISGAAPSGVAWSTALREAMQQWNDATDFTFAADSTYLDPCVGRRESRNGTGYPVGNGDDKNGMGFRTTVCGNSFGAGVLAVTLSFSGSGSLGFPVLTETDVVFNENLEWDIYDGPRRSRIDFRRAALHEFGHALGLDHEADALAIMAPNITGLHTLQADDIAGANALYSLSKCQVRDLNANTAVRDQLGDGDCRVRDAFGGSNDTSLVDIYRLTLQSPTNMDILVRSSELDPVLILTNAQLGGLEIHDDFAGTCDARIRKRLPAGEYRILVNTYERPEKCGGNTGAYSLTLSDAGQPLLGSVSNTSAAAPSANALVTGGATADGGVSFPATFTANQAIDVVSSITPDPAHVGRPGRLYVLAVLHDGRRFMQTAEGKFVRFDGDVGTLLPRRVGTLASREQLTVVSGLRGAAQGITGTVTVYVGYSLDTNPLQIWYGSTPIRFTITP